MTLQYSIDPHPKFECIKQTSLSVNRCEDKTLKEHKRTNLYIKGLVELEYLMML